MSKIRVRAALACRIARLDRVKFNEAVASGAYRCAPETMKGSARIFDEEDLLPLYFFARFLEFGLSPNRAGYLACKIENELKNDSVAHNDRITLVRGTSGETMLAPTAKFYPGPEIKPWYDPDHEKNGVEYRGLGRIVFSIDFYVTHVRQMIAAAIEEERNILGEEDEG